MFDLRQTDIIFLQRAVTPYPGSSNLKEKCTQLPSQSAEGWAALPSEKQIMAFSSRVEKPSEENK
jgi:hypothetical protein